MNWHADGQDVDRHNRCTRKLSQEKSYIEMCLENTEGPTISTTDYMKLYSEQIRAWVPGQYHVLGTDGYGRSDTREKLRQFFEVDRYHVVTTALQSLAEQEKLEPKVVTEALQKYNIDVEKINPLKA